VAGERGGGEPWVGHDGEVTGGSLKGRIRREDIITTAVTVYAEAGYHGSSLREIARRVGITHAGRAYLALANYHRFEGLHDDGATGPLATIATPRLLELAKLLGGLLRVIYLFSASMPGIINNLTFRNGKASEFGRGGGLYMFSSNRVTTEYWIDNVIFHGNSGYFAGGAEFYLPRGLLRVVNSLFYGNSAPTSAYSHFNVTLPEGEAPVDVMVAYSTFVDGACAGSGGRGCGIGAGLGATVHMEIINSLFWGNGVSDVNLEGLTVAGFGNGTAAYRYSPGYSPRQGSLGKPYADRADAGRPCADPCRVGRVHRRQRGRGSCDRQGSRLRSRRHQAGVHAGS
jgi:hypothetical protein